MWLFLFCLIIIDVIGETLKYGFLHCLIAFGVLFGVSHGGDFWLFLFWLTVIDMIGEDMKFGMVWSHLSFFLGSVRYIKFIGLYMLLHLFFFLCVKVIYQCFYWFYYCSLLCWVPSQVWSELLWIWMLGWASRISNAVPCGLSCSWNLSESIGSIFIGASPRLMAFDVTPIGY